MTQRSVPERLRRDLARHPALTRPRLLARRAAWVTVALLPLPATVLLRGVCIGERPLAYAAALVGCALTATLFATWRLVAGRRGGLWPSPRSLRGLALAVPAALAVGQLTAMLLLRSTVAPAPPAEATLCFVSSVVCGVLSLAGIALAFRRSDPVSPVATGAALGVVVGCAVDVAQMLQCPFGDVRHLVMGHLAPILVLGGIGAALAGRLLAVRRA
jgi:hypothetical protein